MNWIVRVYDDQDNIIESWTIENRNESEAMSEAEADIQKMGDVVADWSMVGSNELSLVK